MSDFTSTMESIIADYITQGSGPAAAPDPLYVGLHTGDPGADGTANEVSATDYTRESTTAGTDWNIVSSPEPTTFENANEILFDVAQNSWGSISHVTLWDSETGGSAFARYELTDDNGDPTTKQIDANDQARFPANELSFDVN